MTQSTKDHWNKIYQNKKIDEVSWFQEKPMISLELIRKLSQNKKAAIIDVGGGDSLLIDYLLDEDYLDITVLDISKEAIRKAKERLGDKAHKIKWVVSDILDFKSEKPFDIWHDRACFHFITSKNDTIKYVEKVDKFLNAKGAIIMGVFSKMGPEKCSGIPIIQYSEDQIELLFEPEFKKISSTYHEHITPFDTSQNFIFCHLKKR